MELEKNKEKFIPLYSVALKDGYSFKVKSTANAWWKDQSKVQKLIALLYAGFGIERACRDVGISKSKYKYFIKIHPGFESIREVYKSALLKKASKNVRTKVETDPDFALKYLSKRNPEEYPSGYMAKRIENLNQEHQEKIDVLLGELRTVKHLVAMYQEVTNELLPNTRGWYNERIEYIDAEVLKYNKLHTMNNERIFKYKSEKRPTGHPFKNMGLN